MPSWKTPTVETVERTISLLARPEQRRYFFDKLQNPHWLTPLEERGFFEKPPTAIRDDTEGTIQFPPWPATRYLSRMATLPVAQSDVLRIALNIPATDNITVHKDLVTIATKLPGPMAAQLSKKAPEWLVSPYNRFIAEQLGTAIHNLASNGETAAAQELAKTVLAIKNEGSDDMAHFEPWYYGRILQTALPSLTTSIGTDALTLVADLLQSAAPPLTRYDKPTREDGSSIWHSRIEIDEDITGIKNLLVSATRNVAAQLAHQCPENVNKLVAALQTRPTVVFHRISLDILRREKDAVPELVATTLTNRAFFDDRSLRHEYQRLLHDAFAGLQPPDQQRILAWIDEGPPRDRNLAWEASVGQQPTAERQERYEKLWKRRHLHPIADYLTTGWKERYQAIINEFGPEESEPDQGYTGPTSLALSPKKNSQE